MKFSNKLDYLLFGSDRKVVKFDETKYVEFINGKLICHDGDQTLEVEFFDPSGLSDAQVFDRVVVLVNKKLGNI